MPVPSLTPALALVALAGLAALALSVALHRAGTRSDQSALAGRVILALFVWLGLALLGARVDVFASPVDFGGTPVAGFLILGTAMSLPPIAVWAAWRASPGFRALLLALGLPVLVGVQVYRIGGLVFLLAVIEGTAHPWFGLVTAAADTLVALLALPLAVGLARGRAWARRAASGHALFGLADFAHAIALVALSLFGLLALTPEPALIGVYPGLVVTLFQLPLAVILHALVLHRLLSPAASPNPETAHVA